MELRELLNTSQTPYKDGTLFEYDELWECTLLFVEDQDQSYVLDSKYTDDTEYLTKYWEREVVWWDISVHKDLIVMLEGKM